MLIQMFRTILLQSLLISSIYIITQSQQVYCDMTPSPEGPPKSPQSVYDVTSTFNFSNPRPSNTLGIFTTTVLQSEYKIGEDTSLLRTNMEYVTAIQLISIAKLCWESSIKVDFVEHLKQVRVGNCTFNDNQITKIFTDEPTDRYNTNVTYMEVVRKPFKWVEEDVQLECFLHLYEFKQHSFYLALETWTSRLDDGQLSEPSYKLKQFKSSNFFSDTFDYEKILAFDLWDIMYSREIYMCLLGIAYGDSVDYLAQYCKFVCSPDPLEEDEEEGTRDTDYEDKIDEDQTDEDQTDEDQTDEDKTDEDKTDDDKADDDKTDEDKTDHYKTDHYKTDKDKADEDKTDHYKTDKDKADEDKTDHYHYIGFYHQKMLNVSRRPRPVKNFMLINRVEL